VLSLMSNFKRCLSNYIAGAITVEEAVAPLLQTNVEFDAIPVDGFPRQMRPHRAASRTVQKLEIHGDAALPELIRKQLSLGRRSRAKRTC